ncbi:MAG: hypothetical protein V1726_06345 [Methanobacteriota archaeon]
MNTKEFLDAKEKAMKSLNDACNDQSVDEEILSLLRVLNGIDGCYTSSSCAGRIVVLEIPEIGDKRGASFLGIWHRVITSEEVNAAASKATKGLLWLLAQSPILHVGVRSFELADQLVKCAVSCGFKNSAVKSTGKKIVIEIGSTERLDAPIGEDGDLFCDQRFLMLLVDIANTVIERSAQKLVRFERGLGNI